jgi:hypothetical protein
MYMPLTVVGVGSVALLVLSGRGRQAVQWVAASLHRGPEKLMEWNDAAQRELERIQIALNRVADSLEGAS